MPTYRALLTLSIVAWLGNLPSSSTTSSVGLAHAEGGRIYDSATVTVVRGHVVRVEQATPTRGQGSSAGVHVILKVEGSGTLPVHLGPAWFLEDQQLELRPGDMLVVSGSRVTIAGAPALIARKLVKGDRELVLRDETGVPLWSRSRRSGTPQAPVPRRTDMTVLNATEQQALRDALEDEYKAWTTYDQVIRDFGPERPFINIREAEARHIEALRALFRRYDLEIPANPWPGRVPRYASPREACAAGIDAEIANAALYERVMRSTTRSDLLAVFGNLQRASQERHLEAFRRCATRGTGRGARQQ